jgi:hypothetical protein
MQNSSPSSGAYAALADQLLKLADKRLQPKRRELRQLAARFRAIAATERSNDRREA